MPPEMTQPEALAQMVEGGLIEVLAEMNRTPQQGGPNTAPKLEPAQEVFVRSASCGEAIEHALWRPGRS